MITKYRISPQFVNITGFPHNISTQSFHLSSIGFLFDSYSPFPQILQEKPTDTPVNICSVVRGVEINLVKSRSFTKPVFTQTLCILIVPFRCHFVVWPKQEMNGDLRSQSSSGCPEWPRLPILTSRRRWSELGLLPEFPGKKRASLLMLPTTKKFRYLNKICTYLLYSQESSY